MESTVHRSLQVLHLADANLDQGIVLGAETETRGPSRSILSNMQGQDLLRRIEFNPGIFGGKPIIRGRRMAVEHVLAMLAAGDSPADILDHYPFLESEDIQACVVYAYRVIASETIEPFPHDSAA